MGRRTILTPELVTAIATDMASGCHYDQAAAAAGVGSSTLHLWRQRGEVALEREAGGELLEGDDRLYADFADALEQAKGRASVHAHTAIRSAFSTDWRAAAWYLERTDPQNRYGRRLLRAADAKDPLAGVEDRDAAIAEIEAFLQDVPAEGAVE